MGTMFYMIYVLQGNAIAPVDEPFPHNLDVDPEVVHDCERREDTYMKEHPGRMVAKKAPALPEHLEQNARQLLAGKLSIIFIHGKNEN